MKKLILIFPAFLIIAVVPAFAANGTGTSTTTVGTQAKQQINASPSPSGYQVQNQNQVKTQNQGEDSALQVGTMEQENLGTEESEDMQGKGQNASANMSMVAEKVKELQQLKTTGGLGEQIRQVAQEQVQAHNQIQEHIGKIDAKGQFVRLLTGTDLGSVKNLKANLEQNQLRIKQLEELQTQLKNEADITLVQSTIEAIIQENTSLQDKIAMEEQTKSLFGWLVRLFSK